VISRFHQFLLFKRVNLYRYDEAEEVLNRQLVVGQMANDALVGLRKLNPLDPYSLKAPGFNP
jgi:hypothetical protein